MTPTALNTILNSAPMVIQGASKLIKLIREQANNEAAEQTAEQLSLENLKLEIERLETRLSATDESNIEQIKLIEQLAIQNEALASSLGRINQRLNLFAAAAILAALIAIISLVLVLLR